MALRYDKSTNKIYHNDTEYKLQGRIISVADKGDYLVVVVNEFGHVNMYQLSEENGSVKCIGIGVS